MYSVVLMAALTTGSSVPDCHWLRCHGCSGCNGCYGGWGSAGSWGGWGGSGYWGCNCNYSCWGCYGYSNWGGQWGGWGGCSGCYGCHGCYGCFGCTGCGGYSGGTQMTPVAPGTEKAPPPKKEGGKEAMAPGKAKVIIDVPEDAKLYIDDQLMKAVAGKRSFNTPALERGQTYYYIVRAEVVVDGKTYTESKRVLVRAGEEALANFPELESQLALAKR
jgi:uncharacterized protein (TIGR03000 family)